MIKAFKLITGEEIVSNVTHHNEEKGEYVLDKPRTIMMTPGKDNQLHLSLVPWMVCAQDPSGKSEIDSILYQSAIIGATKEVPAVLEKGYLQNVSTIQLL